MQLLKWVLVGSAVLVALPALAVLAGRMGLLQGTAPTDLGVRDGRLKPPSPHPNSVTSQAALYPQHPMQGFAQIAPLALRGDGPATLERIRRVVEGMPGAKVVKVEAGYLYAQFTTPLMRYVDDVEFWFDAAAGVVQVRSASRLGHGDRGVNRERIEAVRARLMAAV